MEACAIAIDSRPSMHVVIAGEGPLGSAMRTAASAHPGVFEFLGHVAPADIPYSRADVVVSSSMREGSSNVLLEAMATGCPVVATRAGGNVDLVEESRAGILVDVDDPCEMAEALVQLSRSPERREELGSRGRQFIERLHTPAAVVRRLKQIAEEAGGG